LVVRYTVSGTAVSGIDYVAVAGSVVIPAGSISTDIVVTPIDNLAAQRDKLVVLTLASSDRYTIGCPDSALVTILEDDFSGQVVNVVASDPTALENAPSDTGTFTVMRSGSTSSALTVNYTASGTATSGSDYVALSGSVVIAAGLASAKISVNPLDDSVVDGTKTVRVALSPSPGYTIRVWTSAIISIDDDEEQNDKRQTVFIAATDPFSPETGAHPGVFAVTRSGPVGNPLVVNYVIGGTATSGVDYLPLSGTLVVPAGVRSTHITVTPIDDSSIEGDELVVVSIAASPDYSIGCSSTAIVTIIDNDSSVQSVTLVATDGMAVENSADQGVFTAIRSGSAASALTVNYTVSGSNSRL
jgi:hypothetical protein